MEAEGSEQQYKHIWEPIKGSDVLCRSEKNMINSCPFLIGQIYFINLEIKVTFFRERAGIDFNESYKNLLIDSNGFRDIK